MQRNPGNLEGGLRAYNNNKKNSAKIGPRIKMKKQKTKVTLYIPLFEENRWGKNARRKQAIVKQKQNKTV